ncbi:hypothetical protein HN371_03175 [Candidatus Poribacteria bacterium]|jgi:hypothetical protein|nr:hypothetical protein [Candidatus Poribacteria bacterium]MBT5533661.1 hypothetical protein [Candidatus Poribacteria bacterium]MBT5711777.1 hypothetical protein [Candidatus Poribacteria bacterium]MBT7099664.1 hypothetical protein [Candidatus Poribacteria bacterium]MBT7809426.1 hypothetical protein [Candidatus Poribacteria bacterium]
MLEVLALAPADGWAYVRRDGVLLLVRPPYHNDTSLPVDESAVEAAVTKHGFVAADGEFADWPELIAHLRVLVAEAHPDLPSAEEIGQAYWEVADEEDLGHALDHVEQELLPGREYDHAIRLLAAMVEHSPVLAESGMIRRAARLLTQASQEHRAGRADLMAPAGTMVPRAVKHYTLDKLTVWQHDYGQMESASAALSRPNV